MSDHDPMWQATATVEQRVAAIDAAFEERGMTIGDAVGELSRSAEDQWVPQNGARVVARA